MLERTSSGFIVQTVACFLYMLIDRGGKQHSRAGLAQSLQAKIMHNPG
jgi:hypothetical protein